MKKYNTPEIVALTLETVDVIETSGTGNASENLQTQEGVTQVKTIHENIATMSNEWTW